MAHYLLQAAYTSEGWTAQVKRPQNRLEAVRPAIERLGGRIRDMWYSFGEYDIVAIFEMPANVDAAAFTMAVSASGAVKEIKTTPLMSISEGLEAMARAGASGYVPPQPEFVYDH